MRQQKKPNIPVRPTFAMVVDGDDESWYLQMLRRNERNIKVTLRPELPQKKTLNEQYLRVIELANDYDKVFWIIDCDVVKAETRTAKKGTETAQQELDKYNKEIKQLIDAENKGKKKRNDRIIVIQNNPCLEYWLLLHFEDTAAPFPDCDSARKRLKKHLPNYEKSEKFYTKEGKDIYLQLKPNLSKAKARAMRIANQASSSSDASISQMYLLFEALGL